MAKKSPSKFIQEKQDARKRETGKKGAAPVDEQPDQTLPGWKKARAAVGKGGKQAEPTKPHEVVGTIAQGVRPSSRKPEPAPKSRFMTHLRPKREDAVRRSGD
jgi:hypothetical protein